jgi:hypothetical protein
MAKKLVVDRYVVDSLMPDLVGHDRQPSAFLVYLHLWARGGGSARRAIAASHATVAADTGLSKSAVQAAIRVLRRRRLIEQRKASPTAVPDYVVLKPWRR